MSAALAVVGMAPKEISPLVNGAVLEEHASEAGFLWRLRERAIHAPLYRLPQLALLDARVLAHLEGLRTAGVDGFEQARRKLGEIDAATLFVAAYVAFAGGDREGMRDAFTIALSDDALMDALVAALAWQSPDAVFGAVSILGRSRDAIHRRACLAVYAAHRVDPGSLLTRAVDDPDPKLRARALRAAGELGRGDLADALRRGLSDPEMLCRFWAAWSLALSGTQYAAQIAYEAGRDDAVLSRGSLEIAMRAGEPHWARELIRSLAVDGSSIRQAIQAAGAFGDPAVVPWLLELTTDKVHGRVAAEAIASITGADLDLAALKEDAPKDAENGHADDASLRWPNPEGLQRWWQTEHTRFSRGDRYLAGLPLSEQAAFQVLRRGYQRQRRSAAIELARLRKGAMVFPIAARADWQQRRLSV